MRKEAESFVLSKELGSVWKKEIVFEREREEKKLFFLFAEKIPEKFDLTVRLRGRKDRAEIIIAFLGKNADTTAMNVRLIHDAPETYGRIMMRAAFFDGSKMSFKGVLEITERAKRSDSYLSAKALLMSPQARAELYPYLEIRTDEIKASHGSSVGRIDENALLYLQARGIKAKEAEKIILSGFFGDFADVMRI